MYRIVMFAWLCIALFCPLALVGQTLSHYKGSYQNGQANYTYYENANLERIMHGEFSYTAKLTDYSPITYQLTGAYKHNTKHGVWACQTIRTVTDKRVGTVNITESFTGTFTQGQRQGVWTYTKTVREQKNSKTAPTTTKTTAQFNFVNNTLTGHIDFDGIKGQLSPDGLFTGNWQLQHKDWRNDTEYLASFYQNTITGLTLRQMATGQINYQYREPNVVMALPNHTQAIQTHNGQQYQLVPLPKLDPNWGEANDQFFISFYTLLTTKLQALDTALQQVPIGSNPFTVIAPLKLTVVTN